YDELAKRIDALEARVREVEALQDLTIRLLSTRNPLESMLAQHGATESQQQACYRLLDQLAARTKGPAREHPSRAYFFGQLDEIFPALRDNRAFTTLLIDTLKVDRQAYRELHAYMAAEGWLK